MPSRNSAYAGLVGSETTVCMPIRSRKSRIAMVSASWFGEMILALTTSGWATVEVQSDKRSVMALWNSSSRRPRGISR